MGVKSGFFILRLRYAFAHKIVIKIFEMELKSLHIDQNKYLIVAFKNTFQKITAY